MVWDVRASLKKCREHEAEFSAKIRAEKGERENVNFHDRKREIDKTYDKKLAMYKAQLADIRHSINAVKREAKDELMSELIARLYEGSVFEGGNNGQSRGCLFTVTKVFKEGVRLKTAWSEQYHSFASLIWAFDWFSFKVDE